MNTYKIGLITEKTGLSTDTLRYYEKINRTYFDGDFTLLSNWLGTELDFNKIQNLLFGQAVLNLKEDKFIVNLYQNKYLLTPKKEYDLFTILFLINPDNFKISSQEISQKKEDKKLIINYNNYMIIGDEVFPKQIHIAASDTKNISTLDVNYRLVEFNNPLRFPFKIPRHYKRIVLK